MLVYKSKKNIKTGCEKTMMCEYFCQLDDINKIAEGFSNQFDVWDKILSHSESFLNIIVDLLVAILGVVGIRYLFKLREKSINSTFSYFSRLKVRLHLMNSILEEYKDVFLNRFVPEAQRHDLGLENAKASSAAIDNLISTANETVEFLKNEEDQFPASLEWIQYYKDLLDFLYDCSKLNDETYFKWKTDCKEKQELYYKLHKTNLEKMLNDISKRQEKLQKKIDKRSFISITNKKNKH